MYKIEVTPRGDSDKVATIYFNDNLALRGSGDGSSIHVANEWWEVLESPEEIIAMIDEQLYTKPSSTWTSPYVIR